MTAKADLTAMPGGADEAHGRVVRARAVSLLVRPFRPGEIPAIVDLDLGAHAEWARRAADRAGVPVELYVRVAVEAARHVRGLRAIPGTDLFRALDGAARRRHPLQAIDGAPLFAYAAAIRRGGAAGPATSATRDSVVSVAVTQEMVTAWSIAAAESGTTRERLAQELIGEAAGDVMAWEATAAERGSTLGEWIYETAASVFARSSAAPQR